MTTAPADDPRPFYGWVVVGAVFVMLTVSAGLGFYGLSVYLDALADEGLGVGAASLATGVFFLVAGLTGVGVARLLERADPRPIVVGGCVLAAAGLYALGTVRSTAAVLAAYTVLAVGFAASSLVPGTTLVARWFARRRALALSIASTGLSLGGVAITPLVAHQVGEHGLAAVAPWVALAYLVGIVPVTVLLRGSPAQLGQQPDGDPAPPPGTPPVGMPYAQALRDPRFAAVTAAHLLAMLAQVGGLAHLVSLVGESVDAGTAAAALSVTALCSLLGRLAGGIVMTRLPLVPVYVVLAALQGTALLLLGAASTAPVVLALCVLFGITVGNLLMLHPLLLAEVFGVRDYARLYARSNLVATLGIAAGPALMGLLHDVTGDYLVPFAVAALASAAAAPVLGLGMRRAGARPVAA